jgi:hypothetical protein
MTFSRTLALCLLGAFLLNGCTSQKQPEAKPAPSPIGGDVVAAYQKKHPDALIGRVVSVRPQDRLVAVGNMPVDQLKTGDAVVIIGSDQEQIATGDVVSKGKEWIHVHYSDTAQRVPALDDLVVRFKH